MSEIEIRTAVAADIASLIELDHSYSTDHVWQMDFQHQREQDQISATFRKVRLPRTIRYEVPRPPYSLAEDWQHFAGLLVATIESEPIGYAGLLMDGVTRAVWIADLVVSTPMRRQGIGTTLIYAVADWANIKESNDVVLEVQPRNNPAINMALKLGFEFCGYNDFYYPGNEIGLFFRRTF
jgi:RimJ/RimL family protein N-acetyltransferase